MNCCPLSACDDDGPSASWVTKPRARKEWCCAECREVILVGAVHEKVAGVWDGTFSSYRTCLSCAEIRNHFACEGYIIGQVWSDIEENFFPDMKAGGPCMEGLSPEAKGRLFDLRMKWLTE
jgi:hypothetical protein